MATSETEICNMALAFIGASRLNSLDDDSTPQAIQCRTHYDQTRDALIRSHPWRFASDRATLSQDTDTPDSEYDYQYALPNDFLALKSVIYEDGTETGADYYDYTTEGLFILTNDTESDDTLDIKYVKRVEDVTKFDPLFIEVLVIELADKLLGPLAGGDEKIANKIERARKRLMPLARTASRQETNTKGRRNAWVDYHY